MCVCGALDALSMQYSAVELYARVSFRIKATRISGQHLIDQEAKIAKVALQNHEAIGCFRLCRCGKDHGFPFKSLNMNTKYASNITINSATLR